MFEHIHDYQLSKPAFFNVYPLPLPFPPRGDLFLIEKKKREREGSLEMMKERRSPWCAGENTQKWGEFSRESRGRKERRHGARVGLEVRPPIRSLFFFLFFSSLFYSSLLFTSSCSFFFSFCSALPGLITLPKTVFLFSLFSGPSFSIHSPPAYACVTPQPFVPSTQGFK